MYKLGITGGIGSGKSTASNYLINKGAKVFDADEEAKNILLNDVKLQNKLIQKFGSTIIIKEKLNLNKLSELIFSNKKNQLFINEIIWPQIFNLIESVSKKEKNNNTKLFIVDAALIIEANYTHFFNSILLISTNKENRINRIKARQNIPEEQIEKRMALQMSESEKQKHASTIIENNGNLNEFYLKLDKFWKELTNNFY